MVARRIAMLRLLTHGHPRSGEFKGLLLCFQGLPRALAVAMVVPSQASSAGLPSHGLHADRNHNNIIPDQQLSVDVEIESNT